MRRYLPPIALLIVAALFLAWWFSPVNVLKRRVGNLFDTAAVPPTMSDIARSSRGPNVAEYLANRIEVDAPDDFDERLGSSYTRDNAAAYYSGAARYCRQVTFLEPAFENVEITGEDAKVRLRIDTIVELPDRRPVDGILIFDMDWTKAETGWLLKRAAWEETGR
ncbi:MAG: hypothetical protein AAGI48_02065 [Verrucomicrobiota bacterium]